MCVFTPNNKISTETQGTWTIFCRRYISPTDSAYSILKECIENNRLEQSYLQDQLGWRSPIIVDKDKKLIDLRPW